MQIELIFELNRVIGCFLKYEGQFILIRDIKAYELELACRRLREDIHTHVRLTLVSLVGVRMTVTDEKKLRCWGLSALLIQSVNSRMETVEGHQGYVWVYEHGMNAWACGC